MTRPRVLAVASEFHPLVKTGGLADVAGALPRALARAGVETLSLIPAYPGVLHAAIGIEEVYRYADLFGGPARLARARHGEAGLLLLVAPHLYERPGGPYQAPDGSDWPDNWRRFAALAWAARDVGFGALGNWRPDLVHAHDWQAGLAPAYLAYAGGRRPATVFTVHNLAFQGQVPASLLGPLRLPPQAWSIEGVEYYGSIGYLKAGLYHADRITTVSPTYAREIQRPEGGMGLDGLLRARGDRLRGIVNGIDETEWNPATDPHLAARYGIVALPAGQETTARAASHDTLARAAGHDTLARAAGHDDPASARAARRQNRAALSRRLGLDDDGSPLVCAVSRLTAQKGIDLLLAALPDLLGLGGQLAVLGRGDPAFEAALGEAARRHPGRVACHLGHDEALAHLLQGGADAIVVPSRFEPCGLTQLYGMRYGCVPIVARVGGLADTVIDANEAAREDGVATGLQFAPASREALSDAFARAAALFRDGEAWAALQARGMSRALGWERRAEAYASLYRETLAARAARDAP